MIAMLTGGLFPKPLVCKGSLISLPLITWALRVWNPRRVARRSSLVALRSSLVARRSSFVARRSAFVAPGSSLGATVHHGSVSCSLRTYFYFWWFFLKPPLPASDELQATSDGRRAASGERRATSDERQEPPATSSERQRATSDERRQLGSSLAMCYMWKP